jgi:hypothetical protein
VECYEIIKNGRDHVSLYADSALQSEDLVLHPKHPHRVWLHCVTARLPVKVRKVNKSNDREMGQTYQSK